MEYEIVELKERTVAGLTARTSNTDEKMGEIIDGLWQRFYGEGIYAGIPDKVSNKAIGLYSEYETDVNGEYSITVCCETKTADRLPDGCVKKTIPAGKYAKFIVKGDLHQAVAEFWQKLWQLDLKRSYAADFEEYQNGDMENAEIHMYIAIM